MAPPSWVPCRGEPRDETSTLCLLGIGSSTATGVTTSSSTNGAATTEEEAAAAAAAVIKAGIERFLEEEEDFKLTGCVTAVVVEASRTFLSFNEASDARACRERWDGQPLRLPFLPRPRPVCVQWAVPLRPRRSTEPEDDVTATAGVVVPGLGLIRDFVSPEEEAALLAALDAAPWDEASVFRRTQHYGAAAIDFRRRDIARKGHAEAAEIPPIPPLCRALQERARRVLGPFSQPPPAQQEQQQDPGSDASLSPACCVRTTGPLAGAEHGAERDQMTVNDYKPGEGISPHIDVHSLFEDTFLIVSLGSDIVMDFRRRTTTTTMTHPAAPAGGVGDDGGSESARAPSPPRKALVLPARSLLVVEGEARYGWSHGIASRKSDKVAGVVVPRARRASLSFRRVRDPPICDCAYPDCCDTQQQPKEEEKEG